MGTGEEMSKWDEFIKKVGVKGSSFGDAEVQRAINAGYTTDDVNDYLRYSGITPSGNFGVAGYTDKEVQSGAGEGTGWRTEKSPYYRFFGSTNPAPKSTEDSGSRKSSTTPAAPSPSTAPGNPALMIPGIDVRLLGENIGIRTKRSSARRSGQINRGTSRLTIPRSAGARSLNIG